MSGQVGNTAKLREALESFVMEYDRPTFRECECTSCRRVTALVCHAKAALAAPPRNCDVGTAEEQAERFKRFCDEHTDSGSNPSCGMCPILSAINRGGTKDRCPFYWAQMTCLETDGGGAE